jgi:hypothetical protein
MELLLDIYYKMPINQSCMLTNFGHNLGAKFNNIRTRGLNLMVRYRGGYRASSRGGAEVNDCARSVREFLATPIFSKPHPPNSRETIRKHGEISGTRVFALQTGLSVRFYS